MKLSRQSGRGLAFLFLLILWMSTAARANTTLRDEEISQCLPGEISTWGDGQDRAALSSPLVFVYNHALAPPWFDATLVQKAVQNAAQAWSQCGVPSKVLSWPAEAELRQGAILVQWSEQGSRRNFGLANLGERTLSLGPAAFDLLKARNPAFDSRQTLQMVISHEMGHLFGLMAHSRRCVDVTSYYNNGQGGTCAIRGGSAMPGGVEYRSVMPTACDLQRCRIANGKPTTP